MGDDGVYHSDRGDETRQELVETPIASAENPVLSKKVIEEIWEEIQMETDPEEWYKQMADAKASIGRQSIDGWYRELAQCETVCAQVVHKIWAKHMEAVSRLPHFYFRYYLGSDRLQETYGDQLDEIAIYINDNQDFSVLLVGRASRIGSRALNYDLSRRRADAVRKELVDKGVEEGRIEIIYLGYEPPQINEEVRGLYRLDEPAVNLGHPIRDQTWAAINQSVLAILVPAAATTDMAPDMAPEAVVPEASPEAPAPPTEDMGAPMDEGMDPGMGADLGALDREPGSERL